MFRQQSVLGHVTPTGMLREKGRRTGIGSVSLNENAPDAYLSHGALLEQPLSLEAVSSAQLISRSRSDHPLKLDELVWTLPPSRNLSTPAPQRCQRLIIPFEKSVRCTQHAVALGFVLFSQSVPHLQQPPREV